MDKSSSKLTSASASKDQWTNPIEFLMTCIGYAVGLANVWRFPYLCFENGGSAFLIPFVLILFLIGIPLFYLELTISQYSKYGPLDVWAISPLFKGLGYASLLVTAFICIYYNVIICYCFIYLISSFIPDIPWSSCSNTWNNKFCSINSLDSNTSLYSRINNSQLESPSRQFFLQLCS